LGWPIQKKTQQISSGNFYDLTVFFSDVSMSFVFVDATTSRHVMVMFLEPWLLWFPSPATRKKSQQEAAARAPPVDSKLQLVEKLRKAQSTENGRVLWWSFCNLDLILVVKRCWWVDFVVSVRVTVIGNRSQYSCSVMILIHFDTIECIFLK